MIFKKAYLSLFLISGIFLSCVAAIYSITGLISIFKGAPLAIMLMGITLESIKVLISIYIHLYYKIINKFLLFYLFIALVVLMFITSLGVYGYLSKAFSNSTDTNGISNKIEILNLKIETERSKIKNAQDEINSLNDLPKEDKKPWHFYRKQTLGKNIESYSNNIEKINEQYIQEKAKINVIENEVGPLKYLSRLIYGSEDKNSVTSSIQILIILIVVVFDPLAILSIIASISGFKYLKEEPKKIETVIQDTVEVLNEIEKEIVEDIKEEFIEPKIEKVIPVVKEKKKRETTKKNKKEEQFKEFAKNNISGVNPKIDVSTIFVSSYEQKDNIQKMYNSEPLKQEDFVK